jgi:hypothetical protein
MLNTDLVASVPSFVSLVCAAMVDAKSFEKKCGGDFLPRLVGVSTVPRSVQG